MSFVTAARDYVDWVNAHADTFHNTLASEITFAAFTKATFVYLCQSAKNVFVYILTLQWLRDLAYLPVLIPDFTFDVFRTVLVKYQRLLPVTTSAMTFSAGLPTLVQNKFVVGLLNSFFASLPFTFAHLLSARQLYVNGWRASVATNAGIIVGHVFFLAAILFGWRPVLMPWLQAEWGTYVIALAVTYYTAKSAFGRNAFKQIMTPAGLAKTAGVGFLLAFCDQGVLFKYLSTFTFGLEPTYLEPLTGTASSLTQAHLLYLVGFLLGSILFTSFFLWLAILLRDAITEWSLITFFRFNARVNTFSKVALTALLCTSLSFYGLEYLCTKPLGFVPYDRALMPGLLQTNTYEDLIIRKYGVPSLSIARFEVPDKSSPYEKGVKTVTREKLSTKRFPIVADMDLAPFDRGTYFRRAMGSRADTKTYEDNRLPASAIYESRFLRQPRPSIAWVEWAKKKWGTGERLGEQLARMIGFTDEPPPSPVKKKLSRDDEIDADLREQAIAHVGAFLSRIDGKDLSQDFGQFKVFSNVTLPFDPYGLEPTPEQSAILRELDEILNQPKPEVAWEWRQWTAIENLITRYEQTMYRLPVMADSADGSEEVQLREGSEDAPPLDDAPLLSRFSLWDALNKEYFILKKTDKFELRIKAGLEGNEDQDKLDRRTKLNLTIWPDLLSSFYEKVPKRMIGQRTINRLLREDPSVGILFRWDIDSFLSRQPKGHLLSSKEEAELFFKRVMLKNLIQTKRQKRKLMLTNPELAYNYKGGKSFASNVYNHQFNGTYKVVRQLLRMDLDPVTNVQLARVTKFDMPLFTEGKDKMVSVHEELFPRLTRKKYNRRNEEPPKNKQSSRLRYRGRHRRHAKVPPFYAGWDEDRRAFVLTNRFLPTRVSSRAMRVNENYSEFAPFSAMETSSAKKSKKLKSNVKRIAFTTWPISQKIADDVLLSHVHPSTFLADTANRHRVLPRNIGKARKTTNDRQLFRDVRSQRSLIRFFIPEIDFRPIEIAYQEMDRPGMLSLKWARREANRRIRELDNVGPPDEPKYLSLERWPSGFIVPVKGGNIWWPEGKPLAPFADSGGYIWPGHERLKIKVDRFFPKWMQPFLNENDRRDLLASDWRDFVARLKGEDD